MGMRGGEGPWGGARICYVRLGRGGRGIFSCP